MSETIVTNLAASTLRTNSPAPGGASDAARGASGSAPVTAHVIDRFASILGAAATLAFVLLLVGGREALGRMIARGDGWLLLGLALALSVIAGALVFRHLISPMVGNQLRELAEVAEAVATGDLTTTPDAARQGGQLGRLARAMVAVTGELRDLSALLHSSAAESTRLSTEITHGTEHMAQAASGIATTASSLSDQAHEMARSIEQLTGEATQLSDLAQQVTMGARDGVARNARVRALASENHERLDESAHHLDELAGGVRESARATESLAAASDQIRAFVLLVQKIARQSKLLALNAAMEAARAGEQGDSFAVVANEVRRLAATAAEAAEQTGALMKDVLGNMETARLSSELALASVAAVQSATTHGRTSFTQVEAAVAEAEEWTATIAESASAGSALAGEITRRLDSLAAGTQSFAGAMRDVAAASEEQSASTEQIAAASAHLTLAAERVSKASQAFRTG
jgi:methyl-accepting chemotaxis protein